MWVSLDLLVLLVPLDLLAKARLWPNKFLEVKVCQVHLDLWVPWDLQDLLEKEVLQVEEVLKVQPVCLVFLEVLEDLEDLDLLVNQVHQVNLVKMENREENIARMISEKFALLYLETDWQN